MIDSAAPRRLALPFALLPLAVLFLALMGAGLVLTPPPVRDQASADQFDTNGARERLARILGDETPHPIDSAAQDVTRAALLREIEALGLRPEVREMFGCRAQPRGPLIDCALARNIVFSVGPESGPAVLATAHYDSVPAAPGASDDGVGLAVWLEVARVLSHEQLTRRVIFLFTDGEEPALMGALQFANRDPLMQSVESLVNVDSRGNRGPAIFFESNQPNADAIAAFARAPRGIANSVMADAYQLLPNSSDVTAFMRPGLDIINIALLDGLEDYHTPNDTLAAADPRSMQHIGDIALEVTRRFASESDPDVTTPMVYTDIASRAFVSMPSWAGQAMLAFALIVAFVAFWRAGPDLRWRTLGAPPLAVVLAGVVAYAVSFAFGLVRPNEDYAFAHPEASRAWCALIALASVIAALMALRVARRSGHAEASAQFWFALIGFVASIFLSGISILFALPAALYAIGCLVGFAWKPAQMIGGVLSALLAVLVWAPLLYLTELALGFEFPFATSALIAMLALTWVGPMLMAQGETRWRGVALTVAGAALVAIGVALTLPAASAARPQRLNINYFVNVSDDEARILAGNAHRALPPGLRGAYTAEEILPGDLSPTWAAPAPVAAAPAPTLQNIVVADANGERVVRGRIVMNGAYRVVVRVPRADQPLRGGVGDADASFADTEEGSDYVNVACQGRACDGMELTVVLSAGAEPGDWYVIGQTPGAAVPDAVRTARAARPDTAIPIQFGDSVVTLTRIQPSATAAASPEAPARPE